MIQNYNGKIPLVEYPWHEHIDRLADWAVLHHSEYSRAFCYDLAMFLAFIDATSGLERYLEICPNCPESFNAHVGFINMCSPCYEYAHKWVYQKAAKPQSGALGKLSSEIILRFISRIFPKFESILSIGGTETADAIIEYENGTIIFAEVKAAPLLTYPVIFDVSSFIENADNHEKVNLTSSQLRECNSALYLHNQQIIPLGHVKSQDWPFKEAIDFILEKNNSTIVDGMIDTWFSAMESYKHKDRNKKIYYLANASGNPPLIAKQRDNWPDKKSISDSKTSAGMDRTDDIKKGIYQAIKIGTKYIDNKNVRTALISNLPAFRHRQEYVDPFLDMIWGYDKDTIKINSEKYIKRNKLKWVFDYIITLSEPVLRDLTNE
ncbi:MAG: hypothetical protein F6J96_23020 [Symploca sp. SIO1C2]|nr:hypothetical protein [Symploca sp. SIO1C2]